MRLDTVAARFTDGGPGLPATLPAPPAELLPVQLGADGRAAERPVVPLDRLVEARATAVLVLLVPGADGEACVVLTERVDRGGHHSGEVSFPGGAAEPGDADPVATALREAAEEIALDAVAAEVRVVGLLDPFWIPVSNFRVTPVLAIAGRAPALAASPDEVARIAIVPLAAFVPGAPIAVVDRTVRDWSLRYGAYEVAGLHIWGATARILGQLGALVSG